MHACMHACMHVCMFGNQQHNYSTRTCQNVFIPKVNHEFAKKGAYGSLPQQHITQHMEILLTKYTFIVLLGFVYTDNLN